MKKLLFSPRFILPVAILTGVVVIGVRIDDAATKVASGELWMHKAQAEDASKSAASTPAAEPSPVPQADIKAPTLPENDDENKAEMDVLKQLSNRREQLEQRSKELDTREALLKVTEQRIGQKMKELETLRQQLQQMVGQAGSAQQVQLDNLVKIYETMKPDEAAKIFETLEMNVTLGVIQRMKPAKTALIMAKMPPEKAKEITMAMTKQDQLPQIK